MFSLGKGVEFITGDDSEGFVLALGVGTIIYLPFIADRDKLRGLFEEGDDAVPEGARRQLMAMAKQEAEETKRLRMSQQQQQQEETHQRSNVNALRQGVCGRRFDGRNK